MRILFSILILVTIFFTSCDGRQTKNEALAQSLKEFNKNVTIQYDEYIPLTYTEQKVDTTLSNGYRVKIKTYTDMHNSIAFTTIKDTINYSTYYRNFEFDITVEKKGKHLFSEHYNKQQINKIFKFNKQNGKAVEHFNFEQLGVLKSIEVNENPIFTNRVVIDVIYEIPESGKQSFHKIIIDSNGKAHYNN